MLSLQNAAEALAGGNIALRGGGAVIAQDHEYAESCDGECRVILNAGRLNRGHSFLQVSRRCGHGLFSTRSLRPPWETSSSSRATRDWPPSLGGDDPRRVRLSPGSEDQTHPVLLEAEAAN